MAARLSDIKTTEEDPRLNPDDGAQKHVDGPYCVATCRELAQAFVDAGVARPMRIDRYDAGDELTLEVTGVSPAREAAVRLAVESFVGGGFAGQVYRVKALAVDGGDVGIAPGGTYAMKILVPPGKFALRFRNLVYWLGFQSPFSLQVNPAAARAGAARSARAARPASARRPPAIPVNSIAVRTKGSPLSAPIAASSFTSPAPNQPSM